MDSQGLEIKPQPKKTRLHLLKHSLIRMIHKFGLEFMRLVVEEISQFVHRLLDKFGHGDRAIMANQVQQDRLKINLHHKKSISKGRMKRMLKFCYLVKLKSYKCQQEKIMLFFQMNKAVFMLVVITSLVNQVYHLESLNRLQFRYPILLGSEE